MSWTFSMLNTVRDKNVSTLSESEEHLNTVWTCLHDSKWLLVVHPTIKNWVSKVSYNILSIGPTRFWRLRNIYLCEGLSLSIYIYIPCLNSDLPELASSLALTERYVEQDWCNLTYNNFNVAFLLDNSCKQSITQNGWRFILSPLCDQRTIKILFSSQLKNTVLALL